MTTYELIMIIFATLTLLVTLGVWSAIALRVEAVKELIDAQLSTDEDGGSLIQKVNSAASAIQLLQQTLERMETSQRRDSDYAKDQWRALHDKDADIINRLEPLEKMAKGLQESLPDALAKQNRIEERQIQVISDVKELQSGLSRLWKKVFPDE